MRVPLADGATGAGTAAGAAASPAEGAGADAGVGVGTGVDTVVGAAVGAAAGGGASAWPKAVFAKPKPSTEAASTAAAGRHTHRQDHEELARGVRPAWPGRARGYECRVLSDMDVLGIIYS
jgi:hypothetical protein